MSEFYFYRRIKVMEDNLWNGRVTTKTQQHFQESVFTLSTRFFNDVKLEIDWYKNPDPCIYIVHVKFCIALHHRACIPYQISRYYIRYK